MKGNWQHETDHNGGVPYGISGSGDPQPDDAYPFGENAAIAVASGATLDFDSCKMKIAALALDAPFGYGGKISRFTPAEQGVLHVTANGNVEALIGATVVCADEVEDARRLRNWKVIVDGKSCENLILKKSGNVVRLERRAGLVVVYR